MKKIQLSTRNNNPKMIFLDSTLTLVFGTVNSNKLITKHVMDTTLKSHGNKHLKW